MTIPFNLANQKKAILVQSNFEGYLTIWGHSPFWIGDSEAGIGTLSPAVPDGKNFDTRDGIYIQDSAVYVIPWSGPLYILNGDSAADQQNNLVTLKLTPKC